MTTERIVLLAGLGAALIGLVASSFGRSAAAPVLGALFAVVAVGIVAVGAYRISTDWRFHRRRVAEGRAIAEALARVWSVSPPVEGEHGWTVLRAELRGREITVGIREHKLRVEVPAPGLVPDGAAVTPPHWRMTEDADAVGSIAVVQGPTGRTRALVHARAADPEQIKAALPRWLVDRLVARPDDDWWLVDARGISRFAHAEDTREAEQIVAETLDLATPV